MMPQISVQQLTEACRIFARDPEFVGALRGLARQRTD
jgi:hypothetical protein